VKADRGDQLAELGIKKFEFARERAQEIVSARSNRELGKCKQPRHGANIVRRIARDHFHVALLQRLGLGTGRNSGLADGASGKFKKISKAFVAAMMPADYAEEFEKLFVMAGLG
jgi:hypothetical protein